jgi:hypothetical protein
MMMLGINVSMLIVTQLFDPVDGASGGAGDAVPHGPAQLTGNPGLLLAHIVHSRKNPCAVASYGTVLIP